MAEIKLWGETHLADETVEANSGLGKAIRYFIKHYEGLSLFCQVAGAKLDNNAIEAMLKIVVRDRKTPCSTRFYWVQQSAMSSPR